MGKKVRGKARQGREMGVSFLFFSFFFFPLLAVKAQNQRCAHEWGEGEEGKQRGGEERRARAREEKSKGNSDCGLGNPPKTCIRKPTEEELFSSYG